MATDRRTELLKELDRMRDWLSRPKEAFHPLQQELGISDAIAEEVLILLELKELDK